MTRPVPAGGGTGRAPRRNRVTPLGDIVAIPLRGAWMGNRGALHRGTEIVAFHRSAAWITCALEFKDWRVPQWAPGHYTLLFFHDEAVSLAAGHRPCALCRRPAYRAFRVAAAAETSPPNAKDLDRALHAERLLPGTHRRRLHRRDWAELPDGAFVFWEEQQCLVVGDAIVDWTVRGYTAARSRPTHGRADVITPPTIVTALRSGYPVQIDGAAARLAGSHDPSTTASGPTSATEA